MPTPCLRLASRAVVALGIALALPACAPRRAATGAVDASARTKRDPNVITAEELTHGQYASAFDAVRALRPQWMTFKGADTFIGEQGEVQVRLDDAPLGGLATLRQVTTVGIASMRFIDGIAAAGRWGGAYTHGAIVITGLKR